MNNIIDISKQYTYELLDRNRNKVRIVKSINIKYAYLKLLRELELDKTLFTEANELLGNEWIQFYKYTDRSSLVIAFSIRRII